MGGKQLSAMHRNQLGKINKFAPLWQSCWLQTQNHPINLYQYLNIKFIWFGKHATIPFLIPKIAVLSSFLHKTYPCPWRNFMF